MCSYPNCQNSNIDLYYITGSYGFGSTDLGLEAYCVEHGKQHRWDYPKYCFNTREDAELKLITERLLGGN